MLLLMKDFRSAPISSSEGGPQTESSGEADLLGLEKSRTSKSLPNPTRSTRGRKGHEGESYSIGGDTPEWLSKKKKPFSVRLSPAALREHWGKMF